MVLEYAALMDASAIIATFITIFDVLGSVKEVTTDPKILSLQLTVFFTFFMSIVLSFYDTPYAIVPFVVGGILTLIMQYFIIKYTQLAKMMKGTKS